MLAVFQIHLRDLPRAFGSFLLVDTNASFQINALSNCSIPSPIVAQPPFFAQKHLK